MLFCKFNNLSSTSLLLALDLELPSPVKQGAYMLRISTIETRSQRRLILEGKLAEPWLGELKEVCRNANETLEGRKLVIDLTDVTGISCEAESILSDLIVQGAKFSCGGVLIRHVLKRLTRRCRDSHGSLTRPARSNS